MQIRSRGWGVALAVVGVAMLGSQAACSGSDSDEPSDQGGSSSSGGETTSSSGAAPSSSSSSGGTSSSGGVEESLSALVTDEKFEQAGPECELDVTLPKVDARDAAVNAAILAEIPLDDGQFCGDLQPDDEYSIEGNYTVTANEWGVLSIQITQSSYLQGTARPSHYLAGHNFDLHTGATLQLASVLNAAGLATAKTKCIELLTAPENPYEDDPDGASASCDDAVDGWEEYPTQFQIEPEGLRVYLNLPHALFALSIEGAFVPWAELEGNITSELIATYVSKQ